ncbi:MAG TPA: hypothetical protein VNS22_15270 [Geminicoccus sp.]|uniref:hypothetical protein n=1 Tax=Geminicoccus sp. TaxID=2024832 RepID=UPI002C18C2DF|nr:hypothetical protein [Geminicoccus sp.]HWL69729.1 hypothetical protein [Geminicoccus sp.]
MTREARLAADPLALDVEIREIPAEINLVAEPGLQEAATQGREGPATVHVCAKLQIACNPSITLIHRSSRALGSS